MISVVMATYNGSKYISKQLESIANQTLKPDEVIICDDNSEDNTIDIINEFIKVNNLLGWKLYTSDENKGHYETFFKGIFISKGDIVFLSDQDDVWNRDKIEVMSKIMLEKTNISLLECKSNFIDNNDILIKKTRETGELKELSYLYVCRRWGSGYTMAIRKQVINSLIEKNISILQGFDYHDVLIAYFSGLIGEVYLIDKVLDNHRLHENNVTKKITSKSLQKTCKDRILYINKCKLRINSIRQMLCCDEAYFTKYIGIDKYNHRIKVLNSYLTFLEDRKKLLEGKSVLYIIKLLAKLKKYDYFKTFISDVLYAYRINELVNKVLDR